MPETIAPTAGGTCDEGADEEGAVGPGPAALALAPADADLLTVPDWAAIKDRLGAGELTSESNRWPPGASTVSLERETGVGACCSRLPARFPALSQMSSSQPGAERLQADRSEFWRSVGGSTGLLTDGALRAENSREIDWLAEPAGR